MSKATILLLTYLTLSFSARYLSIDADFNIQEFDKTTISYAATLPTTVATIKFDDQQNSTGWSYLYIETQEYYLDALQTAAAGYLEGYATYDMIWNLWNDYGLNQPQTQKVKDFVANQTQWIKTQIQANKDDDFWDLVNTTIAWEEGMYAGYIAGITKAGELDKNMTYEQFHLLSYVADLGDVQGAFGEQSIFRKVPHCSFLLRLTEYELYGSQTTWSAYNVMIRIYKYFSFNLKNELVHNQEIAYSSYAGTVPSVDDYYVLSNNKFVAETTLSNNNNEAFSYIHFDSVPYWIRIMAANFAFDTMDHWVETFFSNRSGTYNNQWMIVDYEHYAEVKDDMKDAYDVIWMVEEFYALTSVQDVTQDLLVKQGYVAGYNVPYNATIEQFSKNPTNYTDDPRAILFAKYAPGIQSFDEFQYVMRLNNHSDTRNYCQAIASRCDLDPKTTFPWGAIDCKCTSDSLIYDLQSYVQSGPTHELEAPFDWGNWTQFANLSVGMPQVWNFSWVFSDPHKNTSEYELIYA